MVEFLPSREVAVSWGEFSVRWYGVLYLVAYGLAWWLMPRLQKYRKIGLTSDQWLVVMVLGVAGVLIGGRLGYVVFYEPLYFEKNLAEIFFLWQGGMSIHGGIVGVAAGLLIAGRYLKVSVLKLADVVVVPAGLGIALGRVGNLINRELFVSPEVNIGVIISSVVIAGICFWYLVKSEKDTGGGRATALFLILVSGLRFFVEYGRVQEYGFWAGLARGQWLSVVGLVGGLALWLGVVRKAAKERELKEA